MCQDTLKYTLNVDEENKVGGKLTVWFRSLLSLLGEPAASDRTGEGIEGQRLFVMASWGTSSSCQCVLH